MHRYIHTAAAGGAQAAITQKRHTFPAASSRPAGRRLRATAHSTRRHARALTWNVLSSVNDLTAVAWHKPTAPLPRDLSRSTLGYRSLLITCSSTFPSSFKSTSKMDSRWLFASHLSLTLDSNTPTNGASSGIRRLDRHRFLGFCALQTSPFHGRPQLIFCPWWLLTLSGIKHVIPGADDPVYLRTALQAGGRLCQKRRSRALDGLKQAITL